MNQIYKNENMEINVMNMTLEEFKRETNVFELVIEDIQKKKPHRVDKELKHIDLYAEQIYKKYLQSQKYRETCNKKLKIKSKLNQIPDTPIPILDKTLNKKFFRMRIEDSDSDTSYNSVTTVIERKKNRSTINFNQNQVTSINEENDFDFDQIRPISLVTFEEFKELIQSQYDLTDREVDTIQKLYLLAKDREKDTYPNPHHVIKPSQQQAKNQHIDTEPPIVLDETTSNLEKLLPEDQVNSHLEVQTVQISSKIQEATESEIQHLPENNDVLDLEEQQLTIEELQPTKQIPPQVLKNNVESTSNHQDSEKNQLENQALQLNKIMLNAKEPTQSSIQGERMEPKEQIRLMQKNTVAQAKEKQLDVNQNANMHDRTKEQCNSNIKLNARGQYISMQLNNLFRMVQDKQQELDQQENEITSTTPTENRLLSQLKELQVQYSNQQILKNGQKYINMSSYMTNESVQVSSKSSKNSENLSPNRRKGPIWPSWLLEFLASSLKKPEVTEDNLYDVEDLLDDVLLDNLDYGDEFKFDIQKISFNDIIDHSNLVLLVVETLKRRLSSIEPSMYLIKKCCNTLHNKMINENHFPRHLVFTGEFAFVIFPNLISEAHRIEASESSKRSNEMEETPVINKKSENVNVLTLPENSSESSDLFASSGETNNKSKEDENADENLPIDISLHTDAEELEPHSKSIAISDKLQTSNNMNMDTCDQNCPENYVLSKEIKQELLDHSSHSSCGSEVQIIDLTISEPIEIDNDDDHELINGDCSNMQPTFREQNKFENVVFAKRSRKMKKLNFDFLPKRNFSTDKNIEKRHAQLKRKAVEEDTDVCQIRHEFRPLAMVKKSRLEKTSEKLIVATCPLEIDKPEPIDYLIEDASQLDESQNLGGAAEKSNCMQSASTTDLLNQDCSIFTSIMSNSKQSTFSTTDLLNQDCTIFANSLLNAAAMGADQIQSFHGPNNIIGIQQPPEVLYRTLQDGTAFKTITELSLNVTSNNLMKLNYSNRRNPFLQNSRIDLNTKLNMYTTINIGKFQRNAIKVKENPYQLIINLARCNNMLKIYDILKSFDIFNRRNPFGSMSNRRQTRSVITALQYKIIFELFKTFPKYKNVQVNYKRHNSVCAFKQIVSKPQKHLTNVIEFKFLKALE